MGEVVESLKIDSNMEKVDDDFCIKFESENLDKKNDKLMLKNFCKQQVVDLTPKIKAKTNKEKTTTDLNKIRLVIVDEGEDRIIVNCFVNGCKLSNEVSSDFFFPYLDRYSVMTGGDGELVILNSLKVKPSSKFRDDEILITNEDNKFCSCCSIF